MKIAYNPKDAVVVTATTAANNDILFDLNARKVWAKGLRMGADWEDISNKPSSLKNPTALTTFGVVYDGSIAKTVTPSNFIGQLQEGTSAVTDGTMFITSVATNNGFSDTNYVNIPYKRKVSCLWDYIKTKTDALYSVIEHNHDSRYLKLTGGFMDNGARIGIHDGGDLYIGDEDNGGWLYFQDIASQDGYDFWCITTDGTAQFRNITIDENLNVNHNIYANYNINVGGQIYRDAKSISWNKGREGALLRETSSSGYHTLWSLKTKDGSWEFGEYNINNDYWNNVPLLSYVTDDDFNNGTNETTYQIRFPLASGTVALTSNILNPTNYYWANVKISDSSSTTTSPTVSDLIATNSIRMGDIYLQNGNEINNSSSNLYLNYGASGSINMCHGGGSVIIGQMVDNIGDNKLYVNGSAFINGSTTLNSTVTLNGLVTNNRGILPASYDVNKNGTACFVWGDAMSTGVTAITDALDPRYVTVKYSQDNGTTWTNYLLSNYDKFSLYANNGGLASIYLGQNRTPDNNGTVSLAQVQKNQLMITFEIPNSLYSELCWASVDIGDGVQTVCTVEIIGVSGAIINTFTKNMYGWNRFNYINFMGNSGVSSVDIGKNDARFVRFKFKHDASNTAIRNAQIRKIRLFSYTKYNIDSNDFRSTMGNTGHLYKYDENLNVTFPSTLKTTALEVSGNASFYDLYCNTLNHSSPTGTLIIGDKTRELSIRSSNAPDLSALYLDNKLSSNVCFSANQGFCITPYYLALNQSTNNVVTISGNKYMLKEVGGGDAQTTSCIIATKSFIPPEFGNIRGQLIRFLPGEDGQMVLLKDLYNYGNGILDLYVQPKGCNIVRSDNSDVYIADGTISDAYHDGDSRFFVFAKLYNVWIEFYCS